MTFNDEVKVDKPNKTEEEIVKEDMDEIDRQLGTVSVKQLSVFCLNCFSLKSIAWNGTSHPDEQPKNSHDCNTTNVFKMLCVGRSWYADRKKWIILYGELF